jgi:uncharacterized protein
MRVTDVRPVAGSTALPPGYPHPHASQEARAIAEAGMILRAQIGSGVHGTAVAGQDDRDELGICLEPPQFITGLARVPNGTGGLGPSVRFEQYERHTAWDRPGGVAGRSGAGDLADQAPVNLGDAITGIDECDLRILIRAVLHAAGRRQFP